MKKIYTLLVLALNAALLFSQSPESFKYQAVVRDNGGNLVENETVGFRITILQSSPTGTPVYTETHSASTNEYGLVNLTIGDGTSGDDFSAIDWGADEFFIKVEADLAGGTSYQQMGTSQLLSVPYALYSKTAGNVFGGDYSDLTNTPDFSGWDDNESDDFSGDYNDLTNKPTINNTQWTTSGSNIYYNGGNVGINDNTPDASLDVQGTVRIGANAITMTEIRAVTGTTGPTGSSTGIPYPSGYTQANTRVLAFEVNYNGTHWNTQGMSYASLTRSVGVALATSTIYLHYPDVSEYQNKAFRMVLMRVQ